MALAVREPSSAFFAGGTDLVAQFNEGWEVRCLIDLSRIRTLRGIRDRGSFLEIGALTTHWEGSRDPRVVKALPGFARAWSRVANVRVRMAATLGGNLMARRARYEMLILLSALGATLRMRTPDGLVDRAAESLVNDPPARPVLLERVLIPTAGNPRFDYERSLRPITTQALLIRQDASGRLEGRLTLATEHVLPVAIELAGLGGCTFESLATRAHAIAEASAEALPLSFGDPVTGSAYLRQVAQVQLARQIKRLSLARGEQ
jgi:CO/xanthine dehydrogenase FAD-binding subunit